MMFLDLVSELEKKHDIFAKHCYDNRQVYSLENISDLDQEQQPKSDVVYYAYDLSTLHNRKLPRNLIFCGESSFISEQLIPNTIQMPKNEMSVFLEDAGELLHSNYKLQDIYIQMLNAVMRGKGIGAMLENVGNALNTSIAIIDMSGKVISNSIPFQVDEPVWQESIKNGYCPPLFKSTSKMSNHSMVKKAETGLSFVIVSTIICFIFPIGLFSKANCMVTYS